MEYRLYVYTQREYRAVIQGLYPFPWDYDSPVPEKGNRFTDYTVRHSTRKRWCIQRHNGRYQHHRYMKDNARYADYRNWKQYRKHQWK